MTPPTAAQIEAAFLARGRSLPVTMAGVSEVIGASALVVFLHHIEGDDVWSEHRLALPIACALGIEIGMRIAAMNCPECARCATHSYSDATTPGFFFDKCERHR